MNTTGWHGSALPPGEHSYITMEKTTTLIVAYFMNFEEIVHPGGCLGQGHISSDTGQTASCPLPRCSVFSRALLFEY